MFEATLPVSVKPQGALRPRSTLRQKGFKKYLFTEGELALQAVALESVIAPLFTRWQQQADSEPEIVAQYILQFLAVMRPRDFRGGPHGELISKIDFNYSPAISDFAKRSFRSVPLAVNRALVAWADGRARLKLIDRLPNALSVLKMQANGERIVTCVFKPHELTRFVETMRDPLGFVLHDLIHADHFFRFSDWRDGQIQFYQETLSRLENGEYNDLLKSEHLAARFQYVISDMNSHPEHLKKTLETIVSSV